MREPVCTVYHVHRIFFKWSLPNYSTFCKSIKIYRYVWNRVHMKAFHIDLINAYISFSMRQHKIVNCGCWVCEWVKTSTTHSKLHRINKLDMRCEPDTRYTMCTYIWNQQHTYENRIVKLDRFAFITVGLLSFNSQIYITNLCWMDAAVLIMHRTVFLITGKL